MELQFEKSGLRFLQQIKGEVQNQEQTQELRLPEGMPDIGRVLSAWGQVLLRGKEWSNGNMGISGGIMVWVLYEPEEDGYPQTVEAWLPFQMKWELPPSQRDGSICCSCLLKNVDARTTSARKLMIRANVSVLGEAYIPDEVSIYAPVTLPKDVQVLKKHHCVQLARETGEKDFELDEELTLPASAPKLVKLIRFSLHPEMIDRRVMSDKVVYRGAGLVHILYRSEDGGLYSWDFEVPFSQYAELDGEYGPDAIVRLSPALTALEMDTADDGKLLLKAGITCQYLITDKVEMDVIEDAYSLNGQLTPQTVQMELPVVCENRVQTLRASQTVNAEGMRGADVCFYPAFPQLPHIGSDEIEISGLFQLLYYDDRGLLQNASVKWEETNGQENESGKHNRATLSASGTAQAAFMAGQVELTSDCLLEEWIIARQQYTQLSGFALAESAGDDSNRPGLILRKAGQGDSLWSMAKKHGSTPDAIMQANKLEGEPEQGQWVLIPVC